MPPCFATPPAILLKTGLCSGVDAVIKAYRLYLEQCPQPPEGRCWRADFAHGRWCVLLKVVA